MARSKSVDKSISVKIIAGRVEEDPDVSERINRLDIEPEVVHFLRQDSDLASVVNEATSQLVRFIPDASLSLKLLSDPEYDTGEQLFLGISTGLAEDDALEALGRFDRQWWVDHVSRARGLLCIDLSDE